MADGSKTVFDVAADRKARFLKSEKLWSKKRKDIDKDIVTALADAQAEKDPCESNVKFAQVEALIKRRKLATSLADATTLQKAASSKFSTQGLYNIIYVDPPWPYERNAHKCGTGSQYKTMTMDELIALPIAGLAATDAVIVVWTTYHMIENVARLFPAWGFEIKTVFCDWIKINRDSEPIYGQSSYTKPCSEFALLGIRGSMQVKESHSVVNSVLYSRPRGHSRKPPVVRDMIGKLFGDLRRIELFARNRPPDWDVWGNQTDHFTNDWTREDDDNVDDLFLPRVIDRKRQRSDRIYKLDVAGAVESFAKPTVATSFGRLDNQFSTDTPVLRSNVDNDDHDHDGTRRCCLPAAELIPHNQLRNVTRIEAFLTPNHRAYAAVRNTTYTLNSEATVREHADAIKRQQQFNSDILHAINHNKHCAQVRVTAPGLRAPTLPTAVRNNKNNEKDNSS